LLLGGSTKTQRAVQIRRRVLGVNTIKGFPFRVLTESPLLLVGFIYWRVQNWRAGDYYTVEKGNLVIAEGRYYRW